MAELTIEQQQAIAIANARARAAQAKPEQGNMYTQGAEDIVYSPEGIPLTTSSYGSAPTGTTAIAQKALTTMAGVPISMGTGAAKPVLGAAQTMSRLLGGNQQSAPDTAINALNQIESGIQTQSGDVGGIINKGASIAGEVAPYLMSGQAGTAMAKDLSTRIAGAVPQFLPSFARKMVGGAGTGIASALATPENPNLNREQFKEAKEQNIGIQSGIGAAFPVIGKAGELSAALLRKGAGIATGAGEEALSQAFKAGKTNDQVFLKNLKGEVSSTEVLDQAKKALANMRAARSEEYKASMAATKGNQVFLDFKPIEKSFDDVVDSLKSKGVGGVEASKVGPDTLGKVTEIEKILAEWKAKPELHTAGGLDDLKIRLDDVYTDSMTDQAKRVLSQTRNTVKDTIVAQSPGYAKTMQRYEEALKLEREIERALSLGNKASADTAIRKLQSLTRNNVNTSYAYRKELADALKTQGGQDLMPALSGQALSSWTPRGIVGQGADVGALIAALSNPASALSLAPMAALTSPKIMGSAAYGAGKLSNKAMTPEQQKMAKLLIMQSAGKANQGD
jgi:hypothetical protein